MTPTAELTKPERHFLPDGFVLTDWQSLEPFFKDLDQRPLDTRADLEKWLLDMSELEAVVSEDASWRQIRMTCDTTNEEYRNAFTYFCMEIQPQLQSYAFDLNKKLLDCPFIKELDQKKYFTYLRSVKKSVELYREKNVPIMAELSVMQSRADASPPARVQRSERISRGICMGFSGPDHSSN